MWLGPPEKVTVFIHHGQESVRVSSREQLNYFYIEMFWALRSH